MIILLLFLLCVTNTTHSMQPLDMGKALLLDELLPNDSDINAQNNCGNTRLHLAVVLCDKDDAEACRSLIRQGANVFTANWQSQDPLYIAACMQASTTKCKAILTTCASIKPMFKTLLLCCKRYGHTLPKDVLLNCIAPYVIEHAAQRQLLIARQLLAKKYQKTIEHYAHGSFWAIPKTSVVEQQLCDMIRDPSLKELLNPNNIPQLKEVIIEELYASIGMSRK